MTGKRKRGVVLSPRGQEKTFFETDVPLYERLKKSFLKFFRRFSKSRSLSTRGKRTTRSVVTERVGRNTRTVRYRKGENTLAPLQTIMNAIQNGKYNLQHHQFHIHQSDFIGWKRLERENLTLVLVIDVSNSTYPFVRVFCDVLNSITAYFRMQHQDRIGLISLQGAQARIMNHPTFNYRTVMRNLMKLKIHGETPLADGLTKAITMVKLEQYKKPGSRNMVILLSDCYPEPLTSLYSDLFDEPAYREALRVASVFRKKRISLLVINPAYRSRRESGGSPGETLADRIVRESRGKLIRLYRTVDQQVQETYIQPSPDEIRKILRGVEDMIGDRNPDQTGHRFM